MIRSAVRLCKVRHLIEYKSEIKKPVFFFEQIRHLHCGSLDHVAYDFEPRRVMGIILIMTF